MFSPISNGSWTKVSQVRVCESLCAVWESLEWAENKKKGGCVWSLCLVWRFVWIVKRAEALISFWRVSLLVGKISTGVEKTAASSVFHFVSHLKIKIREKIIIGACVLMTIIEEREKWTSCSKRKKSTHYRINRFKYRVYVLQCPTNDECGGTLFLDSDRFSFRPFLTIAYFSFSFASQKIKRRLRLPQESLLSRLP